jgi:hypothetical protein
MPAPIFHSFERGRVLNVQSRKMFYIMSVAYRLTISKINYSTAVLGVDMALELLCKDDGF